MHRHAISATLLVDAQCRFRTDRHDLTVFSFAEEWQDCACHEERFAQVGIHDQVPGAETVAVDLPSGPKGRNHDYNIQPVKARPGKI